MLITKSNGGKNMLRGVNRRIIEISDTGSEYFEKALFFVKADAEMDDRSLEKEAGRIICTYLSNGDGSHHSGFLRYSEQKCRRRKVSVLLLCASFLGVALLSSILLILR